MILQIGSLNRICRSG